MNPSFVKNLLCILCLLVLAACKGGIDDPGDTPDLSFNATITGAETLTIDETLDGGTATTFSAVASSVGVSELFQLNAIEANQYNLSIIRSSAGSATGTYSLEGGVPEGISFANQETGAFYRSTTATLTISKSELFQGVGSAVGGGDTYYIDGSFSATLESTTTPGEQISITGEFSGVSLTTR